MCSTATVSQGNHLPGTEPVGSTAPDVRSVLLQWNQYTKCRWTTNKRIQGKILIKLLIHGDTHNECFGLTLFKMYMSHLCCVMKGLCGFPVPAYNNTFLLHSVSSLSNICACFLTEQQMQLEHHRCFSVITRLLSFIPISLHLVTFSNPALDTASK